ncbi:Copper amine oxidase N-terminal domain-containing protein [Desulforamulus putei DSM 12395]|uniref:Copper amine oxidase N-terminal domain-containing protein n=1 Tax=Desulforamulus putei DSM 12395 TaxID=1121429 RepID=A0A1M4ZIF8_9FIRM|nr:copper amine oxidase N-terminal domain-containing protein [Desulforamulus putei]SHF17356.1 Copper amine oxidase N-terminal domain-containing protein [Desulforamulus putei DSM 12395]
MKKLLTMLMLAVMVVTMAVTPAFAEIIIPGNGGEGVDTSKPDPNFQWQENKPTNPTNPPAVNNTIKIFVNGQQVISDVPPFVDSANRTQAPFRAIGEALGCQVVWINETQKIICKKEIFNKELFKVEMTIGKKTFTVNGVNKTMDTAPLVKNNRTFIPVRALSEALNCNVNWDQANNTVYITSK